MSIKTKRSAGSIDLTRRGAIALAAAGILAITCPDNVYAVTVQNSAPNSSWNSGKTAQELWDAAVLEATAADEPIIEGKTCRQTEIIPYSSVSARATANISVMGQPDVVSAIAVYDTSTDALGNKIVTTLHDTWLTLTAGSVINSTYSYTRIDEAGRSPLTTLHLSKATSASRRAIRCMRSFITTGKATCGSRNERFAKAGLRTRLYANPIFGVIMAPLTIFERNGS